MVRRLLRSLKRRLRSASGGGAPQPVVQVTAERPVLPTSVTGEIDQLKLKVEGLSTLLELVATSSGRASVKRLDLELSPWSRPPDQLALRLGHVPGLQQHSMRTTKASLVVSLRLKAPADVAVLLAAVLPLATPVRRARTGAGHPDVALLVPAVEAAPFVVVADRLLTTDDLDYEMVRATDVLAVSGDPAGIEPSSHSTIITVGDSDDLCVDPAVHRPLGVDDSERPAVTGAFGPDGLEVTGPDGVLRRLTGRHGLTDLGVRALLPYGCVTVAGQSLDAFATRVLRQLSATGLVVSAPGASDGSALAALWSAELPTTVGGLELASVRQRRTAHRDHSTSRLGDGAPGLGAPSVSVLLCSNRGDRLEQVLGDLAGLRYPHLQVVLGLHGTTRVPELESWLAPLRAVADVVVVERAAEVPFGTMLAEMSVVADGELLTKVDDDDHYGADHLWDLVVAHQYSGAAIVGKGAETVYLAARDQTLRRRVKPPERFGDSVAGGTLLIAKADLFAVGGWRPVARAVDRGLQDRILAAGAGIYRTHSFGYVYVRGENGHTWVVPEDYFMKNVRDSWDGLVLPQ